MDSPRRNTTALKTFAAVEDLIVAIGGLDQEIHLLSSSC